MSNFVGVRKATGLQRSGHAHGCKPVEIVPGVWTAHYHDIETAETLKKVCGDAIVKTVVNSATDKCPTKKGSYGDDIEVLVVDGLLDDPEALKKADAMPEGPEKVAAKAAALAADGCEAAGNAKKDFEIVNKAIDAAKASGGVAMVHCYASISRSAAFILAYMMKDQKITLIDAIKQMRKKWDATWPNDSFVKQLLEYEVELGLGVEPGVVEMKVTSKKSSSFYVNSARAFLQGCEDKDGNAKEPCCVLNISGLGDAMSTAVDAAATVEREKLGTIMKIETSYPDMDGGKVAHGCARIKITVNNNH